MWRIFRSGPSDVKVTGKDAGVVASRPSPLPTTPPRWDIDFEAFARDVAPLGNPTRVRLLNYLTLPRYLEEIASFLVMNRNAARKHVEELLRAGFVAKAAAQRETGLVVEYRLVSEKLFELFDTMRAVGTLRPIEPGGNAPTVRTKQVEATARRPGGGSDEPRLVVVYGVNLGAAVPLAGKRDGAPWVLGREPDCDVRLASDPFASGRHAQVECREGGFLATDLYSKNGTMVDWERIPPGQPVPLENGQIVGVGKTLFLFRNR